MCGIAGFLELERRSGTHELEALAGAMAATLRHRGPDASGVWADAEAGIAFGHTRLSIVDLSPAGAQPMVSSCGRFVIVYNGEIFNAAELRPELEAKGRRFRGHSDTEVIVEAFAEWGVEATAKRIIGMFAIAAYDRRDKRLSLVRDRLGIKPLYWGKVGTRIAFASELKAFAALPGWTKELNRDALASYFRFAYVPAPHSIYRGISKLMPGHIATIDPTGETRIEPFWTLAEAAERGKENQLDVGDKQACDMLEALLGDAVGRRLVADVPLGAFLSGGIDSTAVAAMMRMKSNAPVRTYSIGFREQGFDEAPHASAVAAHLGTEHTELYVSAKEAQDAIPLMPEIYDEPFADSSQVPTYLLSKLTRQHVTVALSGDGGDELFAGYTRHRFARSMQSMPPRVAQVLASGLDLAGPAVWDTTVPLGAGAEASLLWWRQNPEDCRDVARGPARRLSQPGQRLGRSRDDRAWCNESPRARSSIPSLQLRCPTGSTACNISTRSLISPTTFSPRSTAPAWRSRSKSGCRSSITAWWNFPGDCHRDSRCGAARENGCCGSWLIGTCRKPCWTGRKAALPCRLARGCGGRYAIGPRPCSSLAGLKKAACSTRDRSKPAGRNISADGGIGTPRCGPC